MKPQSEGYREIVDGLFYSAAFVTDVGLTLEEVSPGHCRTALAVLPRHTQQDTFVHTGVLATMMDHTSGCAAGTLIADGENVLTVELKLSLLRPAVGDRLVCDARVLKPGRTLTFVEAEVSTHQRDRSTLVAKALATIAVVKKG